MTKQTITTEIEIIDGYEFVRIDLPVTGEFIQYYNNDKKPYAHRCEHDWVTSPCLIIRPSWQWPEWLTAEWIAMDENGKWYAYEFVPTQVNSGWVAQPRVIAAMWLNPNSLSFTPPPCTDWKQSKRRNPRSRQ